MPDLRFSVSDGRDFLAQHDLLGHLTPEELGCLLAPPHDKPIHNF